MQESTQYESLPEISIVMTAFNTAGYIPEAIESILSQQTTRRWELIFVDDGSTDESLKIAQSYALRSAGRIRTLIHPGGVNRGISASRNMGLRHARGVFLTFLDSDDVWLPQHLETQATLLESLPAVAMVYAGAERWVNFHEPFDEVKSRAAEWGGNYLPPLLPPGISPGVQPRGLLLEWFRKDESLVPCICTVMVRTQVARGVGGFCDAFPGVYDDQVFHAKVALNYDIYANDVCVARYRQHAASCCARSREISGESERERARFDAFLFAYEGANESEVDRLS